MTRILASATVDQIRDGMPPLFEVRVWGGEQPASTEREAEHVRSYQIARKSDTMAAREGIRLFVEEIEALSEWK